MKLIATRLYLRAWLWLISRYGLEMFMEMTDGSSAEGRVRYQLRFKLPDGSLASFKSRVYEE